MTGGESTGGSPWGPPAGAGPGTLERPEAAGWAPPGAPQAGGPGGSPPGYDTRGYGGGGGSSPQPGGLTERFSAARAYDKLLSLVVLAVVCGVIGYLAVPTGIAFACMVVAFGLVLVSWFRMGWAKVLAPAYAIFEGLALGSISKVYASIGHGIIPVAVVFTGAVFVACLVLYRTGLVKVTPRMVALAYMGGFGILIVGALSLVGLSVPGLNSFGPVGIVFGVIILGIAVLNLFTDFSFVDQAEAAGFPADAEWSAALAMMTALVLVYISILRIVASAYGGGGRR